MDYLKFNEEKSGLVFGFNQGLRAIFFFKNTKPDFHAIFPIQKHTRNILIYPFSQESSDGYDGIITAYEKDVNLGIKTADCLPIIFLSEKVKGVIHAGWRGIINGIFDELLNRLSEFCEKGENITFAIGPHICGNCYEVKEDVSSIFQDFCQKNKIDEDKIIKTRDSKIFIDLFSCASEIINKKIGSEKIYHADICVKEDGRFLSRRKGDMISQPSCLYSVKRDFVRI